MEKLVQSVLLVALLVTLTSFGGNTNMMVMGKNPCVESWPSKCNINGVGECVPRCQQNHGAALINSYCETAGGTDVTCNCAYKC